MAEDEESPSFGADLPVQSEADQEEEAKHRRESSESATSSEEKTNEASDWPKTDFERKLGMAYTIVKILAVLSAGIFAAYKFDLFEWPTIETHMNVTGELKWLELSQSSCLAILDVDVKNLSKADEKVKIVRGRAWIVNKPTNADGAITYLGVVENAHRAKPEAEFEYNDGPLVQEYRPQQAAHHTFEWRVKRRENAYALFEIEAFANGKDVPDKPLDRQYQWDTVCGEESMESPPSAAPRKQLRK